MEPAIRILFVDSDADRRERVTDALTDANDRIHIVPAATLDEALDAQTVDCVVAAPTLADGRGLELYEELSSESGPPFVLLAGGSDMAATAFEAGVDDVVPYVDGVADALAARIESHATRRSVDSTDETAKRQYQAFIDNVPGIVYRSSVEGEGPFRSVYGKAAAVSGYTNEQLETDVRWAPDVIHPADRSDAHAAIMTAIERGDRFEVTYRIRTQHGERRWVRDRGWEVDTTDGIIEGLIIDVTEQMTREQQLQREHQRFSDLFANFPEPTVAYGFEDGTTVFRQVNTAFESLFGLEESEIRGESVNELLVPEQKQAESEQIDQQVETGEMVDRIVTRLAADGRRIFNLRSIPVDSGGEIDGFAVYRDITDRRQRQRELERYETIVETMPMGIVVADEAGTILNVNETGAEMLGYTVDQLQGESFSRFVEEGVISEQAIERYEQTIGELLSNATNKQKELFEAEVSSLDGDARTLEVHTALLPRDDGFSGSVQVYHDITERKENQRELRRQNERLEEFASIVSHDLRNPLNIAKGHVDLATSTHESTHLDTIESALDRMETLIGETLTLARQGEMVTDTQTVDLAETAGGCWEMVETGDATLELADPPRIQADPERVKQLFENLFRNSVEHGSTADDTEPDVIISIGRLSGGFYIADDGPGIAPEEREQVFEAGYTTSAEGTGFGLRIVKTIVEAHNWSISITDSEQGGARFEITGVEIAE